jgi:hypothetical protein
MMITHFSLQTNRWKMTEIVNMKFGSHLYGLNTEHYKGVYLPTAKQLLLNNYKPIIKSSTGGSHIRNTSDDIDREMISLPRFIDLLCNGETTVLDMLHCKNPIVSTHIWEYLVENRTKFYTKNMSSYMGYCTAQVSKYGMKGSRLASLNEAISFLQDVDINCRQDSLGSLIDYLPLNKHLDIVVKESTDRLPQQTFYRVLGKMYQTTNSIEYVLNELLKWWDKSGERTRQAMNNEGVDFKALSHALRVSYQMYHIFEDGDFEYPLPETSYILDVKLGKVHATDVLDTIADLIQKVNDKAEALSLPDDVNKEIWYDWLISVYEQEFCIEV